MKQINVAMIPEVLAGIVKQLEVIDGWLSLKTEPVLNGTIGPHEDWIDIYRTASADSWFAQAGDSPQLALFPRHSPLQVRQDRALPPPGD